MLPPGFTGRTNDHPGGYTCNNPGMAVRTWSFYGCVVGIVWLLRVTKRECTSGLAVYWEIGDCGNWRLVFQFRNFSISQLLNQNHARAAVARTKINIRSSSGFGSLRRIFHATKLIDDPSARERPRTNRGSRHARAWHAGAVWRPEKTGLEPETFRNGEILGEIRPGAQVSAEQL